MFLGQYCIYLVFLFQYQVIFVDDSSFTQANLAFIRHIDGLEGEIVTLCLPVVFVLVLAFTLGRLIQSEPLT